MRGNRWCVLAPWAESILCHLLKWKMNGGRNETQRGGTSRGRGCRHDSSSSAQPALGRPGYSSEEGRQGQVEVDLQIGWRPQETTINKAVDARSPLERHQSATSLDGTVLQWGSRKGMTPTSLSEETRWRVPSSRSTLNCSSGGTSSGF